jgi:cellulose synthase/poly-beta-1,6-N-acetylglucosamine synthase-like glycosyltransferase
MLAWLSLAFVVYTYFGYAILLRLLPQSLRPEGPSATSGEGLPSISVVIAARNEAAHIGAKLDDIAAQEYPVDRVEVLVGSDGSTDATDEIVRSHRSRPRPFRFEPIGKTAVLNRVVAEATGDILVFMDVRQQVTHDAFRRFAHRLQDPGVAAVGGELALTDEAGHETASGVGVYWKFEKWLRRRESDLGLLTGLSGALYAMKRELFQAPPDDMILDDVMIPLSAARRGYRLIVDDQIRMLDRVAEGDREFRRKVRTLIGNFQLFAFLLAHPRPFPAALLFSLMSHKVCRAVTPIALITLAVGSLGMEPGLGRNALLAGQGVVYGVGAMTLTSGGRIRGKLPSVCTTFCVLNAAAFVALLKFSTGRYRTTWK